MQIATLLPIAPILLLPFILVFFVIVFPFWLVGVAITWVVRLIVRLARGKASREQPHWEDRMFRWVLTWGGFAESKRPNNDPPQR